jgi:hypothetical protein
LRPPFFVVQSILPARNKNAEQEEDGDYHKQQVPGGALGPTKSKARYIYHAERAYQSPYEPLIFGHSGNTCGVCEFSVEDFVKRPFDLSASYR